MQSQNQEIPTLEFYLLSIYYAKCRHYPNYLNLSIFHHDKSHTCQMPLQVVDQELSGVAAFHPLGLKYATSTMYLQGDWVHIK